MSAVTPTLLKPILKVSLGSAESLSMEEVEMLEAYRKAKRKNFADIYVSFQEGKRVKLWLTEKLR